MAQTAQEKKLQKQIDLLKSQLDTQKSEITSLNLTIENLRKNEEGLKHDVRAAENACERYTKECDRLQKIINEFKNRFNPETMTIQKGFQFLKEVIDNIVCPNTKKEVFKIFVAYLVKGLESDVAKIQKHADEALADVAIYGNMSKDINSFVAGLTTGDSHFKNEK